jgi:hypothetical protein
MLTILFFGRKRSGPLLLFGRKRRFSLRQLCRVDAELGTQQLAQPTDDAALRMDRDRRVVALLVHLLGNGQHITGAVLHAQLAPLTARRDDVHFPVRCGEFLNV